VKLDCVQGREALQEFLASTAATEKFIRSVDEKLTESTQKYESEYNMSFRPK